MKSLKDYVENNFFSLTDCQIIENYISENNFEMDYIDLISKLCSQKVKKVGAELSITKQYAHYMTSTENVKDISECNSFATIQNYIRGLILKEISPSIEDKKAIEKQMSVIGITYDDFCKTDKRLQAFIALLKDK